MILVHAEVARNTKIVVVRTSNSLANKNIAMVT